MKTISIYCNSCGKQINKLLTEVNRCKKRGQNKFYCNRSCAGKNNNTHLDRYKDHFKKVKYIRQSDDYSSFRWYIKCAKQHSEKRNHTYDIDLEYLKDLWEKQNGICPFTKQKLELRTHSNKEKANPYSASLDRIDNTKGYIRGNIRFVALIFNYARNTFSDEQVFQFCKQVASDA